MASQKNNKTNFESAAIPKKKKLPTKQSFKPRDKPRVVTLDDTKKLPTKRSFKQRNTPRKVTVTKKQSQSQKVNVETWNKKRFYVVRNTKGNVLARLPVRNSNLTKFEAQELYNTNKTLDPNLRKVAIGKRSNVLLSVDNPTQANKRHKQIGVTVRWLGKRGGFLGETVGYSHFLSRVKNIEEAKQEAFNMAKARAVSGGIIRYEHFNFEITETFYQTYITKFNESIKAQT